MIEYDSGAINALWILKCFHDRGMGESLFSMYADSELDEDVFFELGLESIFLIFDDTRLIEDEREECYTYLFFDPVIDEFSELCLQYEEKMELTQQDNPFRKRMELAMRNGMNYNSYAYGYTWEFEKHGRKRMMLFAGYEFVISGEVICGLLEIYDAFHYEVEQLRQTLMTTQCSVIPFPERQSEREVAA
ncbi:hypothetical protein RFF05_13940 [Bengtsoniella intestinalis]|uniref:hypothetical protein n=1 Tax=Bengtsoniella intestinalis TaxID=3073143 RepID=UPI00391EF4EF